jgi:GNAT superfamily N-acetyltransferase
VVRQLRPQLEESGFVQQALRQQQAGWHATGLFVDGEVRAFAGWRVVEYLVHGRHVYVDDLVTDAGARSEGHGKALLDWLKAEARALGCGSLHLDSGTHRKDAHAFYLREGLRIDGFHFGVTLD